MKNFFAWFLKPAVLSFFGVALLSLLIWFGGPQLGFGEAHPLESETVRWVMIGLLFAIWAGYFLWKMLAAKLANAQLMRSVAGEGQPAPAPGAQESAAEVAQLNKLMQEAMATLKKSKAKGKMGSQYMYQLPWYMFVGAPGTGKTTALTQSGLQFPLAETMGKKAIGGVGGTRNCDWWFTEEAVLLDTAGRYTTQDSYSEVDKAGWFGFLDLLKKHRRRRPINGVIIAVSASELLTMSENERKTQALAIRERIKELHDRLEIRFPIYVLVTKCDLLAGFIEFFDNLGRDERAQVWGTTFPVIEAEKVDELLTSFPQEFKALEQQLQARVLARVQTERDVQRRALIYSFPQQFAAVGDNLNHFLRDVFQSTRYEERALLRGVYFSSGTQEGSPIDRVMGALAGAFGLDRQALPAGVSNGRSYFITRLLSDVIFKEADLVGTNLHFDKKRKMMMWGSCAALALLFVICSVSLGVSYSRNKQYIADVTKSVDALEKQVKTVPQQVTPLVILPVLDAARSIPGGFAEKNADVPFMSRLGLSQRPKLGEGANSLYSRLLKQSMLPLVQGRIEEQLRRGGSANLDELYESLRVYLMMGDGKHFDAETIAGWISFDWDRSLNGATEQQRSALDLHAAALLDAIKEDAPIQLKADLIEATRATLASMALEQKIYNRVKRDLAAAKLPEFSAQNAGGIAAPQVFVRPSGQPLTRGVPGVFTLAGYQKFDTLANQAVLDVAKDSWVLAKQEEVTNPAKTEQIKKAVEKLYYDEYIKQWDLLLADVRIKRFASLDEGARIMNLLGGFESPLKKFMQAAAKETSLGNANAGKAVSDAAGTLFKGKLDAAKEKLKSAIGADVTATNQPSTLPKHPVDAHFEGLHKLAGLANGAAGVAGAAGAAGAGGAGAAVPLDGTIAMLKELGTYLDAANSAKNSGAAAPAGDVLIRLKREGEGKPEPLAGMIATVDGATSGLTKGSERERINSLWTAGVAQFCRTAVAGRYPMVRASAQEVTPDDFGRFFAPGGLIDDFFQKNLAPYVNQGGASWSWRPVGNSDLGIPAGVLAEFQRAAKIRDSFFGQGGKQPSMRFDLSVASSDPALSKWALEIDGQKLEYATGTPPRSSSFQLPSGKGNGAVRFETTPPMLRELRTDGPWAWMRMIDQGRMETTAAGERFKLNYDLDGKKLVLDLRASSVINPFNRAALEQFRCLDRL